MCLYFLLIYILNIEIDGWHLVATNVQVHSRVDSNHRNTFIPILQVHVL